MAEKESKDMEDQIKDPRKDYESKKIPGEITDKQREEMEKTRAKLDKFKKDVLKKFPFIFSIGIIPPQACEKIEEEENVPLEECKKKPIHLILLMPEEKFKEMNKI